MGKNQQVHSMGKDMDIRRNNENWLKYMGNSLICNSSVFVGIASLTFHPASHLSLSIPH